MVLVGCLVTWARSPSVIIHPQLWAEDGAVFLQDAYNQGWHAPLFLAQAGYLQTFSRIIADVGLLLPLKFVPALYAMVALVVQVLPAALLASRRFERAIPDVRVRLLFAAVYLVVPNSAEINVDLTNAQWHLAVLAVLIVLALPPGPVGKAFDLAFVALSCLTGPFVLSLVVVTAITYYVRRQVWTLVLGIIVLVSAGIQLVELLMSTRQKVGPLGITISRFVEVVGGRLIGGTVLGGATSTSTWFVSHLMVLSTLFLVGAIAVVTMAVWRGPFELKMFNLWAAVGLAGSLASPLASIHGSQWQALIGDVGIRYWFFPSLAMLADILWLTGQIRADRRWVGVAASLVLLAIATLGIREDFRYTATNAPSWSGQVEKFDRRPPSGAMTFKIRPPGWTMTLIRK